MTVPGGRDTILPIRSVPEVAFLNAVVSVPVCPLFSRPDPRAERVDELLSGMTVELGERAGPDFWQVRTGYRYEGFAPARCLLQGEAARRWEALPKRTVLFRSFADVLSRARFQSPLLTTLPLGSVVAGEETGADWEPVVLPDGRHGQVRRGVLGPHLDRPAPLPEAALRRRLVETARRYWGAPYRWGGKTPLGIDCSGLVSMTYLLNGIAICRDAHLADGFPLRPIPTEEAKPGDLLYFPGHVALYLGRGRYLHATGRAGVDGVTENSLNSAHPLYRPDLAGSLLRAGTYF